MQTRILKKTSSGAVRLSGVIGALITAALVLAVAVTGCGGGGGDTYAGGGIGGSGYYDTSAGVVTEKGSITVNGVRFETDEAVVTKEDNPFKESDLEVGMVVEVHGRIHDDGLTGRADEVIVHVTLSGAIDVLHDASFVVLEQKVRVDGASRFVDKKDTITLDDLVVGDAVEVSGLVTPDYDILASLVERTKDAGNSKLTGFITAASPGDDTFYLNTLLVDYSEANMVGFKDGPPAGGDYVVVKGELGAGARFAATKVQKKKGPEISDDQGVHLEGFIGQADGADFLLLSAVGPVSCQVDEMTVYTNGGPDMLVAGRRVAVDGYMTDTQLVVDTVSFTVPPVQ